MPKTCRVKKRTQQSKKRRGFCIKTEDVYDDVNNDVNTSFPDVNATKDVNISSINASNTTIPDSDQDANISSASAKKIQPIEASTPTASESITGYRYVDMEILSSVFSLVSCPLCGGKSTLKLLDVVPERKGLSSLLSLKCKSCSYLHEFYTSRSNDYHSFDINKRIVYSMRACGQGHAGIETRH